MSYRVVKDQGRMHEFNWVEAKILYKDAIQISIWRIPLFINHDVLNNTSKNLKIYLIQINCNAKLSELDILNLYAYKQKFVVKQFCWKLMKSLSYRSYISNSRNQDSAV